MNLAQVSVYQIKFGNLPIRYNDYDTENIELLCESAELPGTSFMTHEQSNDYAGITERFAYRRSYTQKIPLTFMVDREYKVIDFFDRWMDYINNNVSTSDMSFGYRMKYPDGPRGYRADMFLTKFEKDAKGPSLEYKFLGAYPESIDRMGVNYNNSNEILRCVVTMSFVRYVRGRDTAPPPESSAGSNLILQQQAGLEAGLDAATNSNIRGTTSLGLTGSGTLSEANEIRNSGNVNAFSGVFST